MMKPSPIVVGLVLALGLAVAQNPQQPAGSQSGSGAQSQSKASASAKTDEKAGNLAELKTQTFTGVLLDGSCAAGGSTVASSNASSSSSAKSSGKDQSASDRSSSGRSSSKTGEASRNVEASQSCAPSANTTEFGLRMKDGRVMRFDAVGNERAKEAFSAKKKWSEASTAGKAIQASVSGTQSGDTVTVVSIH